MKKDRNPVKIEKEIAKRQKQLFTRFEKRLTKISSKFRET